LIDIVAQLRSPTGCPWDRAQTPQSLTPFILEEAYEAVAAIRSADLQAIADELGDLLLQVVLQAQIFSESGVLTLAKIAAGTADKLIRRHPHVFEAQSDAVQDLGQLHQTWEQIKQAEQPEQTLSDKLLHYAHTLPPLMAALKISNKVVRAGFEWPEVEGIWAKMREEEAELREVLAVAPDTLTPAEVQSLRRQQSGELGDLLFTLVNLGRWYGLEAAEALQSTNLKFAQRFQRVEQLARELHQDPPRHLSEFSVQELDELWQQAKAQESP
jgi:XTP/dITP diphosphohydrolase